MAPGIPDGANVVVDKTAKMATGDMVVIWLRPELVTAEGQHQAQLKRLAMTVPSFVKFPHKDHPDSNVAPLLVVKADATGKHFGIRCRDVLALHKCEGLMEGGVGG